MMTIDRMLMEAVAQTMEATHATGEITVTDGKGFSATRWIGKPNGSDLRVTITIKAAPTKTAS